MKKLFRDLKYSQLHYKKGSKITSFSMTIARQIIEEKHGDAIICSSELGKGTEFIISLPIN